MTVIIHPLKVVYVESLAPNIIQLLLEPEHPITYASGQYIMLGFNASDLKPFSIASAPREDGLIECHIRNQDDRDWMGKLFVVRVGEHLVMKGPKDQIQLKPAHQPVILVAGGTGFAPMKSLLDSLLKEGSSVPIYFYWGARSVNDLYMHTFMQALTQTHANLKYIPVISEFVDNWNGLTGLVHSQVLEQQPNLAHSTLYMSGPWPMLQQAKADFFAAGLHKDECIY